MIFGFYLIEFNVNFCEINKSTNYAQIWSKVSATARRKLIERKWAKEKFGIKKTVPKRNC